LAYFVRADGTADTLLTLRSLATQQPTPDLLLALAEVGDQQDCKLILDPATLAHIQPPDRNSFLAALGEIAARRDIQPMEAGELLLPLLGNEFTVEGALGLGGIWKTTELRPTALDLASDTARPVGIRCAALRALGRFGQTSDVWGFSASS